MGQLEDFLQGIPLSDENAALLAGFEPAAASITGEAQAKLEPLDELTEDDRQWLRRMYHEPGYKIFLRRLNSAIQRREEGAKLLSSTDPLSNQTRIVNEWAYIACFKAVLLDMQTMLQNEMSDG